MSVSVALWCYRNWMKWQIQWKKYSQSCHDTGVNLASSETTAIILLPTSDGLDDCWNGGHADTVTEGNNLIQLKDSQDTHKIHLYLGTKRTKCCWNVTFNDIYWYQTCIFKSVTVLENSSHCSDRLSSGMLSLVRRTQLAAKLMLLICCILNKLLSDELNLTILRLTYFINDKTGLSSYSKVLMDDNLSVDHRGFVSPFLKVMLLKSCLQNDFTVCGLRNNAWPVVTGGIAMWGDQKKTNFVQMHILACHVWNTPWQTSSYTIVGWVFCLNRGPVVEPNHGTIHQPDRALHRQRLEAAQLLPRSYFYPRITWVKILRVF